MDVVHIARAENGNYLVTYMVTKKEFEELRDRAKTTLLAQLDTQDTD